MNSPVWTTPKMYASSSSEIELHLSRVIQVVSQLDMQKIWITGFFFENRLIWQFEVKKKIYTNHYFWLHIYLQTTKTLTHTSLYVFYNWGKNLSSVAEQFECAVCWLCTP
jgi:hypothetical protein